MGDSKGRIVWIDLARCMAIIFVVLCHATESIYSLDGSFMMEISTRSRIFAFASFTIGRLGVPLFLFITGYLLLDREYDTESWLDFWKHKLLGLLLVTEIWIVIYNLFLVWYNGTPFSLQDLILNMLFMKNVDMPHFWYMPMILGVYLFLPLLANCLQKINKKILYILIAVIFVYTMLLPLISVWYQITNEESLSTGLDLQFLGGYYGLYLIMGWLVKKGEFEKVKTWILAVIGIVAFISTVGIQLSAYQNGYGYNVWYSCGFLMVCALCIFLIISRMPRIPLQTCADDISRKSFGIFLVHYPILLLIKEYTNVSGGIFIMPVEVILLFIGTFIISWIVVTLILKIPKVGKFLVRGR